MTPSAERFDCSAGRYATFAVNNDADIEVQSRATLWNNRWYVSCNAVSAAADGLTTTARYRGGSCDEF